MSHLCMLQILPRFQSMAITILVFFFKSVFIWLHLGLTCVLWDPLCVTWDRWFPHTGSLVAAFGLSWRLVQA